MLACLIIAGILLFLLIVLLLPVSLDVLFDDQTVIRVYYCGFPVYRSAGEQDKSSNKKQKKNQTGHESKKKKKKPSLKDHLSQLHSQQGITGTVEYAVDVLRLLIEKCGVLMHRLHFSGFRLCLTVASDNPAKTAIDYGIVCAAIYPLISFLFQKTECKAKQVDISADFQGNITSFRLSFSVRTTLLVLLATALQSVKAYNEIKDVYFNE